MWRINPGPQPVKDAGLIKAARRRTPTGFRMLATLAGAVPGLYIMFQFPHEPVAYAGPFVSLACLAAAKPVCRALFETMRGRGATHYESIQHPEPK